MIDYCSKMVKLFLSAGIQVASGRDYGGIVLEFTVMKIQYLLRKLEIDIVYTETNTTSLEQGRRTTCSATWKRIWK